MSKNNAGTEMVEWRNLVHRERPLLSCWFDKVGCVDVVGTTMVIDCDCALAKESLNRPNNCAFLQDSLSRLFSMTWRWHEPKAIKDNSIICPICDAAPHISGVNFGKSISKESKSGPGLIMDMECENGHAWKIAFDDHSAGIWISVEMQNNKI